MSGSTETAAGTGNKGRGGGDELVLLALGGLGEIGMNCYLYGAGAKGQRRWLMVDLGITFPEGEFDPGVDVILPDLKFIQSEISPGSGRNQPLLFRRNAFRQGEWRCPETVQADHRLAAAHKTGCKTG